MRCLTPNFLSAFTSRAPGLERIKLCGVPAKALIPPSRTHPHESVSRCCLPGPPPVVHRTHSSSLSQVVVGRSGRGPEEEEGFRIPFEIRLRGGELRAADSDDQAFCFLIAWDGLVGEDVGVEYSRDKVEKLAGGAQRIIYVFSDNEKGGEQAGTARTGGGSDLECNGRKR